MCSCGTLAVCRRTRTHSRKRARRLLNKQGGKNCGAPVLRRQGEVEMTYNYPSCHVCDESVTTACSFVKHGRGRSGRRLSLRGLGVNKSGPVLRCDTSRLAGRRRCCFCGNKLHKKIPFRISFFIARHFDGHRCKSESDTISHHPVCHLPILFLESKRENLQNYRCSV